MGKISDRFKQLIFHNEAEVSQKFVIPFFVEFLGYRVDEILPEHLLPSFDIPLNRNKVISSDVVNAAIKPDYIIALDGEIEKRVAILDSKGPNENLNLHLQQLKAYCISLDTNLIAITNGKEFRLLDANENIFISNDFEELDLQFEQLRKLLHKENISRPLIDRIKSLDDFRKNNKDFADEQAKLYAVINSDYQAYLRTLQQQTGLLEFPVPIKDSFSITSCRFASEKLYSFVSDRNDGHANQRYPKKYFSIKQETFNHPLLIIGESGIGKSSLLQELAVDQAERCLSNQSSFIPVIVKLIHYTQNKCLVDLIFDELVSKGARIKTKEEMYPRLIKGHYYLLFDAFDEVFDRYSVDVEREIQSLQTNYPLSKFVVTTRHFKLPQLYPMRHYFIERLSIENIKSFVEMYLGNDADAFLSQIYDKGLGKIASNTLILTFLVLLYSEYKNIPNSNSKILRDVVGHVQGWNIRKNPRFELKISSSITEFLLSELAFATLIRGQGYSLQKDVIEDVLLPLLNQLKERHQISPGFTIQEILEILASTGFLVRVNSDITFWHRKFMEYFARSKIANFFLENPDFFSDYLLKPEWYELIPNTAIAAPDSEKYIELIYKFNTFAAAQSIIECDLQDGYIFRRIAESLVLKCKSKQRSIRELTLQLLA